MARLSTRYSTFSYASNAESASTHENSTRTPQDFMNTLKFPKTKATRSSQLSRRHGRTWSIFPNLPQQPSIPSMGLKNPKTATKCVVTAVGATQAPTTILKRHNPSPRITATKIFPNPPADPSPSPQYRSLVTMFPMGGFRSIPSHLQRLHQHLG